jgi:hypothetical protein
MNQTKLLKKYSKFNVLHRARFIAVLKALGVFILFAGALLWSGWGCI